MPSGDPSGYLPSVIKKRLKQAGVKPYKARSKQNPRKPLKPSVKAPKAPNPKVDSGFRDVVKNVRKARKKGYTPRRDGY